MSILMKSALAPGRARPHSIAFGEGSVATRGRGHVPGVLVAGGHSGDANSGFSSYAVLRKQNWILNFTSMYKT